jgi:hypothetical protein
MNRPDLAPTVTAAAAPEDHTAELERMRRQLATAWQAGTRTGGSTA